MFIENEILGIQTKGRIETNIFKLKTQCLHVKRSLNMRETEQIWKSSNNQFSGDTRYMELKVFNYVNLIHFFERKILRIVY